MLKHRIITALGLLTIFLIALFILPPIYWTILMAIVVLLGFHEWLQFAGIKKVTSKFLLFSFLLTVMYCLYQQMLPLSMILFCSIPLWLVLVFATLTSKLQGILFSQQAKLIIAIWLLATSWWLLTELRMQNNGELWILFFLVVIWSADIGAYFAGKRFGKTKLAPSVSPGKTVEGMLGGLLAVSVLFIVVAVNSLPSNVWLTMLLVCLVTALISVGGDLYESQLKRQVGMKDSSNILPGHGGILDRIDSVLAGLPFFIAGLVLLNLIPSIA